MVITSESNKTVKWLESLRTKKYRQEYSAFLAEGERLVKDGLNYLAPKLMVFSESYYNNSDCTFCKEPFVVSDSIFRKISETVNPQGIMAVFPIRREKFSDFDRQGGLLLLNKIMDPGNLGTMIRTAEATGFSHVVLDKGCVDIYNPKVVRSTMSSLFRVHVYQQEDLCNVIADLKSAYQVYAAAYDESAVSVFQTQFGKKSAIIIGNEANGIERSVLEEADQVVYIPMQGSIESLNASVSAAILMYEYFRQINR